VFESYGLSAMLGLEAMIPACLSGALMARLTQGTESRLRRALIVGSLGLAELVVIALLGSLTTGSLDGVLPMLELMARPAFGGTPNAVGLAFFWTPLMVQGVYVSLAEKPRWEIAVLLSGAAVVGGLLFFLVGGAVTGATSD
jgi:hypothetical protein